MLPDAIDNDPCGEWVVAAGDPTGKRHSALLLGSIWSHPARSKAFNRCRCHFGQRLHCIAAIQDVRRTGVLKPANISESFTKGFFLPLSLKHCFPPALRNLRKFARVKLRLSRPEGAGRQTVLGAGDLLPATRLKHHFDPVTCGDSIAVRS